MAVIILFDAQTNTNVASGSRFEPAPVCPLTQAHSVSQQAPAFWPEMLHAALLLLGTWD